MPQRQLKLVFSRTVSESSTKLCYEPRRMSPVDSSTRLPPSESPFLLVMRRLEAISPKHAAVLEGLANDIIRDL
jgi:hypothetical protein